MINTFTTQKDSMHKLDWQRQECVAIKKSNKKKSKSTSAHVHHT